MQTITVSNQLTYIRNMIPQINSRTGSIAVEGADKLCRSGHHFLSSDTTTNSVKYHNKLEVNQNQSLGWLIMIND